MTRRAPSLAVIVARNKKAGRTRARMKQTRRDNDRSYQPNNHSPSAPPKNTEADANTKIKRDIPTP